MAIENAKTLNVRIRNKYDSYENWAASSLILEPGEIAIAYTTVNVEVGNGKIEKHPELLMKVGNGTDTFSALPWLSAKAADVAAWAKAAEKPVYAASEITGIDEKIAQYVSDEMGITTDTDTQYQIVKVDEYNYKLQSKGKSDEAWADVADSAIVIPNDTEAINNLKTLVGEKAVATQISEAIAALENVYAAKEHTHTKAEITDFDHEHAIADVTGLQDALDGLQAKGDYAVAGHKHEIADVNGLADAIADAKAAGTGAQDAVDALAAKVGEVPADKTVVQMIADAQSAATYDDTELANRVGVVEGYVGGKAVGDQISDAIEAALKVDGADKYALAEHEHAIEDVTGLQDAIDDAKKAGTDAAAALETYKGTNDAAVQKVAGDLAAEIERATGVEVGLEERIETMEAFWAAAQADGTDSNVIDTLKEIQEYIAGDESGASEMAASIKQNADDIDALEGLVGGKAVGTQISDAIEALDLANTYDAKGAAADALADANEYADGLNTAMDTRVKAVEEKAHTHTFVESELNLIKAGDVAKWNAAEQNAKDYADSLAENYDEAGAADQALTAANKYTDDEIAEWVGTKTVAAQITDAVDGLAAIAKTGSTDDLVQGSMTLVFDCGGAGV